MPSGPQIIPFECVRAFLAEQPVNRLSREPEEFSDPFRARCCRFEEIARVQNQIPAANSDRVRPCDVAPSEYQKVVEVERKIHSERNRQRTRAPEARIGFEQ